MGQHGLRIAARVAREAVQTALLFRGLVQREQQAARSANSKQRAAMALLALTMHSGSTLADCSLIVRAGSTFLRASAVWRSFRG